MKKCLMLLSALLVFAGCSKDDPKGPTTYTLTVSATPAADGSVSISLDGNPVTGSTVQVQAGQQVLLTPQAANASKEFYSWSVTDDNVTIVSNGFEMPAENVTVAAVFGGQRFAIEVVNGTPNVASAAAGETVTLTKNPGAGKKHVLWLTETAGVDIDQTAGTFTMPGTAVSIEALVMAEPVAPYILYYDNELGNIALGQWSTNVTLSNILYVRFGGLVAMVGGSGDPYVAPTAWDEARVKFNPTTMTFPTYDITNTETEGWPGIPRYYQTTDWNEGNGQMNISAAAYNTKEFAELGKGDICRFVGLTSAAARKLIAADKLSSYNSGYRLPTKEEVVTTWGDASVSMFTTLPNSAWTTEFYDGGAWLASAPNLTSYLPAASYFFTSYGYFNASYPLGRYGTYWTSSVMQTTEFDLNSTTNSTGQAGGTGNLAWTLELNRNSSNVNSTTQVVGLKAKNARYSGNIRCVPETPARR